MNTVIVRIQHYCEITNNRHLYLDRTLFTIGGLSVKSQCYFFLYSIHFIPKYDDILASIDSLS